MTYTTDPPVDAYIGEVRGHGDPPCEVSEIRGKLMVGVCARLDFSSALGASARRRGWPASRCINRVHTPAGHAPDVGSTRSCSSYKPRSCTRCWTDLGRGIALALDVKSSPRPRTRTARGHGQRSVGVSAIKSRFSG